MFLATTALNDFWDKNDHILFLGEWCKLHKNKQQLEYLKHSTFEYPFDDFAFKKQSSIYCKKITDDILNLFVNAFNEIHGLDNDIRYWRIIIGYWLHIYIVVFYEKYICLKRALEAYSNIKNALLNNSLYITPNDDLEFYLLLQHSDVYNLQLYSQILETLGYSSDIKVDNYKKVKLDINRWKTGLKEEILYKISSLYYRLSNTDKIVFADFISKPLFSKMIYALKMGFVPLFLPRSLYSHSIKLKNSMRKELSTHFCGYSDDEFVNILLKLLPQNLPKVFLEGFSDVRDKLKKNRIKDRTLLCTSHIKMNLQQLVMVAESVSNGGKLLLIQHGGGYGTFAISETKQWEVEVAHKFFSWGWSDEQYQNVYSLPLSWRSQRKKLTEKNRQKNSNKKILFIGSTSSRYSFRFESMPIGPQLKKYLNWQVDFFSIFPADIIKKFVVRLHPIDFGWDYHKKLKKLFPELNLDNCKQSYYEQLKSVDLVVIDNNQTTYLEALAFNIPTILFWDIKIWELHKRAEPFFEELSRVGVFHYSPQSAAQKVMDIYTNPKEWWETDEIQIAVENFVDKFARIHKIFSLTKRDIGTIFKS